MHGEVASLGPPAQLGQKPAGLGRVKGQLEGRLIEIQPGIDLRARGWLIDPLDVEREHHGAAVVAAGEVSGKAEGRGLAEHLGRDLDLGHGEPVDRDGRQPARQLRQSEGLVVG